MFIKISDFDLTWPVFIFISYDTGDLVQPGAILFRQKGFRMHPGRNVSFE